MGEAPDLQTFWHLHCLLSAGIPMITVSHVWDPQISAIQQQHLFSPQTLHVRHLAIENPVRIFQNVERDTQFSSDSELWHDYFSVPQWTDQLKSRILLTIHRIFEEAHTTIIHFDGLTQAVVDKLHHGSTSHERLAGLTGVCNEKWFTRMWTAMEFVRSRSVRMMTGDFQLVQGDDGADPAFLGKLHQVWGREVEAHGGDVWGLEDSVGMRTSENLVPWNLGPLQQVRSLHRTNFAMAFALLSKRGCRDEMDFLHGLRGITQSDYEEPPEPDFRRGYLHVAWLCLLAGDYSPLVMTPNLSMSEPPQEANMFTCYNDVWTWGMGEVISPPDHIPEISVDSSHEDTIRARLQPIGIVSMLSESSWYSPLNQFAACAEMTLAQTGPDLNDFVATLGTRLFGEDTNSIMQHIKNQGTARDLENMLMSQYIRSEWRPDWRVETLGLGGRDAIMWLADALHLTGIVDGVVQNRLGLIFAHAGTVHNKPHSKIVEEITNFMLARGLMQDQISEIHQRAQASQNYTEELLGALYPANLFLPETADYSSWTNKYFGSRPRLNPSAVFTPESTEQVASCVKILEFFQRKFAIRGLGFSIIPGMAGIEDGVLIALEKMNGFSLSSSGEVVSLGPGNHWGRVYETLESQGLAVTGGEMAVVGIAGLLTGNGLSYFLGSRGWSSADVANFEVVLAGGKVVNANATENSDLWWALKGGSNNFGIVTRFDMNTFPLPNGVFHGPLSFNPSQGDAALGAFYDMQTGPLLEDPHLMVTCMGMIIPAINLAIIDLIPFTDKLDFTGDYPPAIKPLLDIGPVATNMSRITLTALASQNITPEFMSVYTARINRANINIKADKELYKEISALLFTHYESSTLEGHTIAMSWNPITPYTIRESNRKGGNPGGWQEINQNSLNFRSNWNNPTDDAAALQMDEEFMAKVTEMARKRDALMPNLWMNNAAQNVDVMRSYGEDNYQKLRAVSDKYDAEKTFQRLCPGGYKLGV
ncbi:Bifunctional solanapyrone synthase [Colletotrichum sp. SAR 10_86]|nr:Bifunctional solanapyrone synthase [Colletotrichum sp. SAR 10_86]